MTALPITHLRLRNQLIAGSTFHSPVEAVRWLGAVQSQVTQAGKCHGRHARAAAA
jgi:hypothetical protein